MPVPAAPAAGRVKYGENWKGVPDNKFYVIDLTTSPPAQIATVEAGKQPSGMAINRAGTLAIVANRAYDSVSVLSIDGLTVERCNQPVDALALQDRRKFGVAGRHLADRAVEIHVGDQPAIAVAAHHAQSQPPSYNARGSPDGQVAPGRGPRGGDQ